MKARAKAMASGLEPELSVVVDVLFPIAAITEAAKEFRVKFPGTPPQLCVETFGNIQRKQLVKRNYKFPILASMHSIHRRWVGRPRVPRLQFCASR
jgi:hypothetical protein